MYRKAQRKRLKSLKARKALVGTNFFFFFGQVLGQVWAVLCVLAGLLHMP